MLRASLALIAAALCNNFSSLMGSIIVYASDGLARTAWNMSHWPPVRVEENTSSSDENGWAPPLPPVETSSSTIWGNDQGDETDTRVERLITALAPEVSRNITSPSGETIGLVSVTGVFTSTTATGVDQDAARSGRVVT